jgi:prolipoprotein diacylglyceryltransferase
MLINTTNGSIYFTIFYSLAFLFSFILLLWEGYQRKIPAVSWVLLLIFARISFIAGTKIFTYNREEWLTMIQQASLVPTSDKILLGGIIFGLISLLAGKYILRIKQNFVDAFAIIVPLAIGIQRIGCLLNGCCFGKPTLMPWGVQYTSNSMAHFYPYEPGLTGINELLSLHIHPVQIYEMAGAFLVAFIVFRTRKSWKTNGSLLIFSLLLYSFIRFLTEFFRDIRGHTSGGEMIGFLNQIQWILLIAMFALSLLLLYREKSARLKIQNPLPSVAPGINFCLLIFSCEAVLIWTIQHWFSYSELVIVLITFLISSIIILIWIIKEIASSKSKMIYTSLLLLPLLITSQTIPQNPGDSALVIKTKNISFGLASGSFENHLSKITGTSSQEGCSRNTYDYENFKHKYTVGGAAFSFKNEYPQKKYTTNYGVNLFLGQSRETMDSTGAETKTGLYGLNPYFKIDANWIGIGGGIHVGSLVYPKSEKDNQSDLTTGSIKTNIYPQIYGRLGPRRFLFVDYHLADQFPAPFPSFYQQLGIGTGFGLKNGTVLRAGGFIGNLNGAYITTYLPLSEALSIEPMLVLSGQTSGNFSLGIHYNLSSKSRNKKTGEVTSK